VTCREADELARGGTDFTDLAQIDIVKAELRDLRTEGATIAFHLAVPCATFSHARDRSEATQLRSSTHPEGLPDLDADRRSIVLEANEVALIAFDMALWAAHDLSAVGTFESPATSYIWAFLAKLRPAAKVTWKDLTVSQCMFGTQYRKDRPRSYERAIGLRPAFPLSWDPDHRIPLSAAGTLIFLLARGSAPGAEGRTRVDWTPT
jgi:hypothetical protein